MEDFLRKQLELLKAKQSIFTLMWELRSREAHTVAVFLCQHCSLCLYPTSLDSARPPCVHRLSHLHNTLIGWQEAPPEKHSLPFAFSFAGTDRLAIAKIPPCTVPHQRLRQWKHREHTCQSSDGRTRQLGRVRGRWNVYTSNHERGTVSAYEPLALPSASMGPIEPDWR